MKTSSTPVLHYIYDPLCGWCYAAAPLLAAAQQLPGLRIALHAGGLFIGAQRQAVTENLRRYVMTHDQKIAQLSGQTFGDAYFNGLLTKPGAVFDSAPPIRAILAAQQMAGRGLDLLHRIQQAHYIEGQQVSDHAQLIALASGLGMDQASYRASFDQLTDKAISAHLKDSRQLLARLGAQGFPTLALEHQGQMTLLPASNYYGKPELWRNDLAQRIGQS